MPEPLDILEAAVPRVVVHDAELPGPSCFLGGKRLELARQVGSTVEDRQYDADGGDQVGVTRHPAQVPCQPMSSAAPVLSVVMPVRNAARYLPDALEALVRQKFVGHWELVLVDNGSTDSSVAIALGFKKKLPALSLEIVAASDKLGQAHALNAGAAVASGRSLLFLDADDVVAPGYLAAMADALEEAPFVCSRLDNETLNPGWLRMSRPPTQVDGVGAPFGFLPSAAGCSIGVWRSTFEEIGGFDSTILLGNDVDFSWRLQLAAVPLRFVPEAVVHYRFRESLREIFVQARTYGTAGPTLYKRYRAIGMTRRSWRVALRFHAGALVRLARARSMADLAECAFLFGFRVGVVEGCYKNRVLYP